MPPEDSHRIRVRLEEVRGARGISMAELARQVGITEANLYTLKRQDARAIRFSTLAKLCEVLQCTPGDLLVYEPGSANSDVPTADSAVPAN
ncbi:helix-turn-helix domain-containing protein [Nocardia noduli]|uniref:helix-turn-helix domain-containing protein n=1 Tax=Nocardia noduli TaxID=2815722 RepID=UPI001C248E85|nr:helix-turn-helix transcriptional regulator [Nocardia noduli]